MKKPMFVITDLHMISYGLIRKIGEKGLPIILVYFENLSISRFSKYVKKSVKFKHDAGEKFVEELILLAKKLSLKNCILIPCDDEKMKYCSMYRDELSKYYIPSFLDYNTINVFLDKLETYNLCKENNIPYPQTYDARKIELKNIEIEYPVIIKPNIMINFYRIFRRKAILINNINELKCNLEKCRDDSKYELMIQEYISGGPAVLYSSACYSKKGNLQDCIVVNRIRQHPKTFGTASTFVKVVDIPELETYSRKIINASRYSGVCEIEFMFDKKTKKYKLLEVNPRFWGWHTLTSASGHDFIEKMLQDIFDDYKTEVITGPKTLPSKECWTHLLTDLFIILTEGLKGNMSIRESLNTLHGCEWAICNKDDPLPFILEIALSPIMVMRRI